MLQVNADNIQVKYIGAIDDSPRDASLVTTAYTADAVDAVLNGDAPDPDFVKSIGCTIKWQL